MTKFVAIPFHSDGLELLFITKGVIEIIFIDEILAKFLYAVKMIAVAPHHRFVQPSLATYISFGVGYCFIQQQRQCEKPHQ